MELKVMYVTFMPSVLVEEVLYISKKYQTCAHLCPCGCKSKVRTPLGPTEWSIKNKKNKVSLYPSIGNWQFDCKSHYWIKDGTIIWAEKWSEEEIVEGRIQEERRRKEYYNQPYSSKLQFIKKCIDFLRNILQQ